MSLIPMQTVRTLEKHQLVSQKQAAGRQSASELVKQRSQQQRQQLASVRVHRVSVTTTTTAHKRTLVETTVAAANNNNERCRQQNDSAIIMQLRVTTTAGSRAHATTMRAHLKQKEKKTNVKIKIEKAKEKIWKKHRARRKKVNKAAKSKSQWQAAVACNECCAAGA